MNYKMIPGIILLLLHQGITSNGQNQAQCYATTGCSGDFIGEVFNGSQPICCSGEHESYSVVGVEGCRDCMNDYEITIGMDVERVIIDEGIGMLELCASALGDPKREIVVSVVYQDRGAVGGSDFEANIAMLTFAPRKLQDCFNVTITDDNLYETAEELFVNITTNDTQVTLSPSYTVITIRDNDEVIIRWEMTEYTQSESDGPVELCAVIVSGILTVTIPAINIQLVDGNAVSGDDYGDTPYSSFVFSSTTDVRICITVDIVDDNSFENDVENFFANMVLALYVPRVIINGSQTKIQIIDDDTIVFGFVQTSYKVDEGNGTVSLTVVVISGSLSTDVLVTLGTADDQATANSGEDYDTLLTNMTFSSSVSSQSVDIIINDDEIHENDELFNVYILPSMNSRIQFNPRQADILIMDNDEITIGMDMKGITINEGVGMMELCASALGDPKREVVISVLYQDRGAVGGSDFEANIAMLTFAPRKLQDCFNVTITDDNLYETAEEFFVNITTNDTQVTLSPSYTVITILDNDEVIIGWEMTEYTQSESDGPVELCAAIVSGILTVTIAAINIQLVDGNAVSGDDYGDPPSSSFFAFNSITNVRICITVDIVDDNSFENDVENFFANMERASNGPRVIINGSQTKIQIIDDDTIVFGFVPTSYEVDEGNGTVSLTVVVISGSLSTDVLVTLGTGDDQATANFGEDYDILLTNLTFSSSVSSLSVDIIINDDEIHENDELFNVYILPSMNSRIQFSPRQADILIMDNDEVNPTAEVHQTNSGVSICRAGCTAGLIVTCAALAGALQHS